VLNRDATDVAGLAGELNEQFERIVFADLLEHLPDPIPVLAGYRRLLAPGGRLLVSLPNVAAWTVRLELLFGRFEYAESGILDRTHLRFFTRASGRRTLEAAGYRVLRCDVTPHLTRAVWPLLKSFFRKEGGEADAAAVMNSPAYRLYQTWLEPAETLLARLLPGLFACQFVYEAEAITPE
jgi:SAM-dependent methyltransferase